MSQIGGIVTGYKDTDSIVAKYMCKPGLRKAKRISKKTKKTVSKELSKRPKDDKFVIIKVTDDDIKIIKKSQGSGREYKFPFGKTFEVDLDDGTVKNLGHSEKKLKTLKKGISSNREAVGVEKQYHEEIPVIYWTAHKSKKHLNDTAIGMNDEEEITDVERKKIKIYSWGKTS